MTAISTPSTRSSLVVLTGLLLALTLYINLSKIMLGSRYFMLAGDVLLAACAAASLVMYSDKRKTFGALELLVTAFFILGIIQLFNPNVPSLQVGMEGFRRLIFQMLGALVGIAIIRKREDVTFLWKLVALCSVPILIYSIKQFFVISDFDTAIIESNTADIDTWQIFGKIRAFGLFNGPFHLGTFAAIVFWIALALRYQTGRKRYMALAGLAVCACVASLTRANIIALVGSVPIGLFIVLRGKRWKVVKVTIVVLLVLVSLFAIAYYAIPDLRVMAEGYSALESLQNDSRLQGRFEGYHQAASMLWNYPLGAGMSSAGDATGPDFDAKQRLHITSHNMLLWVAVETGIPGLLLFLGILGYLAYTVYWLVQRRETALAMAACGTLTVITISGITGSTLSAYPINLIFWTLAGGYVGFLRMTTTSGSKVTA